ARLTNLAVSVGAMTHELQKERGATAGFLASNGEDFANTLVEQRELSDAKVSELRASISTLRGQIDSTGPLMNLIMDLERQMDGLGPLREAVDRQEIDVLAAVSTITRLNRSAIALLPEAGKNITYSGTSRAVQRHAILMRAKDITGLERATGATGFAMARQGSGTFPQPVYDRFEALLKEESTLLSVYRSIASTQMRDVFEAIDADPVTQEVYALRAVVESGDAEQIMAVAPEDWFAKITAMIDLIKNAEDAGAAEIQGFMDEALARARADIRMSVAQMAGTVFILLLCSAVLVRQTSRSVRATAQRVVALAEGDIDSEIVDAPQSDLGKITKALRGFQKGELERRKQGELQEQLQVSSTEGIRRIVKDVSSGDFSARLRLRDLQGATLILGDGVNEILKAAEEAVAAQKARDEAAAERKAEEAAAQAAALESLNEVVGACSAGDFSKRMQTDLVEGVWREVGDSINRLASMTDTALADIRRIMSALANGNLGERMGSDYQGTFAEISGATNGSLESLQSAFSQILNGTSSLGEAAAELRQGTTDLASRSDEQSRIVVDSTSATQGLSKTLTQNSESLSRCRSLIEMLETKTAEGQSVANGAVESISRIETVSGEVSKIVSTIEEIAFQTNLLSLNASVEAARAGETGKGFAVVASEVRALASRCADASKQIGDLIAESVQAVNQGAQNVRSTGDAIGEMQQTMSAVLEVIQEVTSSGQKQTEGVEVLGTAISRLDQATQSNVMLAKQNNTLMERMSELEADLSMAVGGFMRGGVSGNGHANIEAA
ncbi:MAG: nitrate- and nitrite sensing domain-containing protein, partial [Pseudomonadota bacterium]